MPRTPRRRTSRGTAGTGGATRNGPGTLSAAVSPPVCIDTSRKPIAAPGCTVTCATAEVGDSTVTPLTTTPAPNDAMLPAPKCVSAPETRTSRAAPTGTADGVTDSTDGDDGASTTCAAPIALADSVEPSPTGVATVTSRNPSAAPEATVNRTTIRVGESTFTTLAATPAPATLTVLPGRKPVPEPVSSASSVAPRGSADGATALTPGRTAESAMSASVFE
jgi:hypothetical protein